MWPGLWRLEWAMELQTFGRLWTASNSIDTVSEGLSGRRVSYEKGTLNLAPSRMMSAIRLVLVLSSTLHASLITPANLRPGDQFRMIFTSSAVTKATSSDIRYYDNLVGALAHAAGIDTYQGSPVNWMTLGSTAAVSAFTRLPNSDVPIFRMDGSLVADAEHQIWSGLILSTLDMDEYGLPRPPVGPTLGVWTGIGLGRFNHQNPLGGALHVGTPPGSPLYTTFGYPFDIVYANNWVDRGIAWSTFEAPLYGFTEVLTVGSPVPEPSSLSLLLGGALIMLGAAPARVLRRFPCAWREAWPFLFGASTVSAPMLAMLSALNDGTLSWLGAAALVAGSLLGVAMPTARERITKLDPLALPPRKQTNVSE